MILPERKHSSLIVFMTSMTSKNLENSVVNIVLYSIVRVRVMVMVLSATYSNISFISRLKGYENKV
jgi:hypothetical protein